jgi:outer membrane protein assembly factor BamB
VFNDSPDADDGGIWASDTGPAADKDGNVFVATGNGRFDVSKGGRDYGDSLLKLSLDGQHIKVADYFAPYNVDELNGNDDDLGSGGPMLLPDQPGTHPHLAVVGGKSPAIYLLDRDRLGQFHAEGDPEVMQSLPTVGGIYGSMAYWNHHVYVLSDHDSLRDYELKNGKLAFKASSSFRFEDHAATPAVSANGEKDGIVWVASSKGWNSVGRNAVLHACDGANIAHELYNSNQNPARDQAGRALRFNIPMIAHGHVYLGARDEVDVYGLLQAGR